MKQKITKEIELYLNKVVGGQWYETDKGINVSGDVSLYHAELFLMKNESKAIPWHFRKRIPIQFNIVDGHFECGWDITTLEHGPRAVGGNFDIRNCPISSLKHSPKEVGEDFWLVGTKVTSLRYSPWEVQGNYFVSFSHISSLEGLSHYIGGGLFLYDTKVKNGSTIPTGTIIKGTSQFTIEWEQNYV